jgi:hypothetical protein
MMSGSVLHDAAVPLSRSRLWSLQREYFRQQGPEAWRGGAVPSFITCNSFIGKAYADVAEAFKPRFVVELGAGSGRFAHFFLKHLAQPGIRYVMTDVSRANIDFWRGHERLRPFVQSGMLDFAQFDPLLDREMRLEVSGAALNADTVDGPVLAIANYVFDSIEQDLFEIEERMLYECRVAVQGDLESATLDWRPQPCSSETRYPDPLWNRLLEGYKHALPDGAFLFPTGALTSVENLKHLARHGLLLLAADKGPSRVEDLRGLKRPALVKHGSVSLNVNFHAISEHVRALGGRVFEPPRHASLNVMGFAFGELRAGVEEAYERAIARRGPDDIYTLKRAMEKGYESLSLKQFIAFLRLVEWDPAVIAGMYEPLTHAALHGAPHEQDALHAGLLLAWDRYYLLGEERDFAFIAGNLAAAMGRYADALRLFQASAAAYGNNEDVMLNIELCRQFMAKDNV